ncbi:MAG: phosphatase PAP2 family protein [Saprospiraceae bacterium]
MKSKIILNQFIGLGILLIILTFNSCRKDNNTDPNDPSLLTRSFSSDVPLSWYNLMLDIDRYSSGYRPPAASRMMGYIGWTGYEAVVNGMPEHQSLGQHYKGLSLPAINKDQAYYWPVALNAAYAQSFKLFYPQVSDEYTNKIKALEEKNYGKLKALADPATIERSVRFGKEVADAVFQYSASDPYGHEAFKNPFPSTYVPPKIGSAGEKLWQPTLPDFTPALFPYWGKVRTFALNAAEIRARQPIPYSKDPGSKFYQQANETRIVVNNLSFEDRWISEFWSDDFFELTFEPAGRQVAIANQMVERDKITMDKAVELYAKLGMAMADAAIAIWNSKYIYNVLRPIEYIRDVMDPNWVTALNNPTSGMRSITPPFPSYPSGHSGFGGSGAVILTDIFGANRSFVDNCHINRYEFIGAPRSYPSFIDAGVENAYSRLTLGVHYRMDCDEGLRLGYLAAHRVLELPWLK